MNFYGEFFDFEEGDMFDDVLDFLGLVMIIEDCYYDLWNEFIVVEEFDGGDYF